jgi:hypothetical protein
MKENEAKGMSRDAALAAAIETVSSDLGTTKDDLLNQIGKTEADLTAKFETGLADVSEKIADSESLILAKMQENENLNLGRDIVLSKAVDDVANDLGITKDELLTQIGKTEADLTATFEAGATKLSSEIQEVAAIVGVPAEQVTQEHINFVADVIAQQELLADPSSFVPTDPQLQYDVNNDGVIDINDQGMLEQSFGGQQVALQGDMFSPTGLYKQNTDIAAQQKLEQDAQFEQEQALEQERQMNLQTQIQTNAQKGEFDDFATDVMNMQAAQQGVVTERPADKFNLDYVYDFGSIFANDQQEQLFANPYGDYNNDMFGVKKAKGGIIESDTDRLIRLIGEG